MKNYKAFTLIELLVVIAIIALLLTVILPSLSIAKERAMEVLCRNNIRQYSIAVEAYAMDYNQNFPNCEDWLYMDFIRSNPRFADFDDVWHDSSMEPDGVIIDYLSDQKVQLCPVFKRVAMRKGKIYNSSIPMNPVFSYSQNFFLGTMENILLPGSVAKISNIKSPSQVVAYGEENPFVLAAGNRPSDAYPNGITTATPINDCLLYPLSPGTAKTTIENSGGKYAYNGPLVDGFATFHRAPDAEWFLGYSHAAFVDGHVDTVTVEQTVQFTWPN